MHHGSINQGHYYCFIKPSQVVSENKETGEIQDFYFLTAENLTEKIEEDRLLQEELAVFLELLF